MLHSNWNQAIVNNFVDFIPTVYLFIFFLLVGLSFVSVSLCAGVEAFREQPVIGIGSG